MPFLITSFVLMVTTLSESRPLGESKTAEILKYGSANDGLGKYSFSYETSDGIQREETGEVANPESETSVLVVRGFYSYTGDDGHKYRVHYVADENGFQADVANPKSGDGKPQSKPTKGPPLTTTSQKPELSLSSSAIGTLAGK